MSDEIQNHVITFYSYKGGTGRTMALANVACLLAKQGKGVLMIDWDLEAPGLHRFFQDKFTKLFSETSDIDQAFGEKKGLIDLFCKLNETISADYTEAKPQTEDEAYAMLKSFDLEWFILKTDIESLYLLKAGRFDEEYDNHVNKFDWEDFYKRSPSIFRLLAERLTKKYQYVLIDSRTGITDIGGICTTLMPDKLVVVFTPNRQNLMGLEDLIQKATSYRKQSDDLRPLSVFPLPSRIENAELDLREVWRYGKDKIKGYQPLFEELFKEIYSLPECDLKSYFDEVQIQHIPRYAYGEEIAVLKEYSGDRQSLTRSYESFTESLVNLAGPWEYIIESIMDVDTIIKRKIKNGEFDVYLSYSYYDHDIVEKIELQLRKRGILSSIAQWEISQRMTLLSSMQLLGKVKSLVVLIGKHGITEMQDNELSLFLSISQNTNRPVITVILPDVKEILHLPSSLTDLIWLDLRKMSIKDAIDQLEVLLDTDKAKNKIAQNINK
jgi:cellulose biosynthesis protein BcsQ